MKVPVAGATGAIGARLVPMLVERGHEVAGSSRSAEKAKTLRAQDAEPVVLDLLDAGAVREAGVGLRPDAIVHQATGLNASTNAKSCEPEGPQDLARQLSHPPQGLSSRTDD
jgi:uncharacterized protein YbjT (DUF2867 family)